MRILNIAEIGEVKPGDPIRLTDEPTNGGRLMTAMRAVSEHERLEFLGGSPQRRMAIVPLPSGARLQMHWPASPSEADAAAIRAYLESFVAHHLPERAAG